MIFNMLEYERMNKKCITAIKGGRNIYYEDAVELGVEYDAISSLFSQIFLRQLKSEIRSSMLSGSKPVVKSIVHRVQLGESLFEISKEFKVGTFKIAKLYLEATLGKAIQVSVVINNPNMIKNEVVRRDILKMLSEDPICSVELDIMKDCIGREYEELLTKLLKEKNMCFETESELRIRGKPKTPDILFLIPMGLKSDMYDNIHTNNINNNEGDNDEFSIENSVTLNNSDIDNNNYYVINWIDSKAMFADIMTFKENLEQFKAYNNRYGRGLVIYWHGLSQDIYNSLTDDMIIIRDRFPDKWIFPTGELADGRIPEFDKINSNNNL